MKHYSDWQEDTTLRLELKGAKATYSLWGTSYTCLAISRHMYLRYNDWGKKKVEDDDAHA